MAKKRKPRLKTQRKQKKHSQGKKTRKHKRSGSSGNTNSKPQGDIAPVIAGKGPKKAPEKSGGGASGIPENVADEVRELQKQWSALSPTQKGEWLEKLLPNFHSVRALGKAMGKAEARIRQLLKVARESMKNENKPEPTFSEAKHSEAASVLPMPVAETPPDAFHAEQENAEKRRIKDENLKTAAPAPPHAVLTVQEPHEPIAVGEGKISCTVPAEVTAKQPAATSIKQGRKVTVQASALDVEGQGKPNSRESKSADFESLTSNASKAGEPAVKAVAQDYAIKDPEVGGKLVATWIRINVKPYDWDGVIADYTTAYWFTLESRKEAENVKDIPAGLSPIDVIMYCRLDDLEQELEGGFFQNVGKKWFARWASILLPDPSIRRKSVKIAAKILNKPEKRWNYLIFATHLIKPTPCIRSSNELLADFLESLTKYLNVAALLREKKLRQDEVEEALRYAAATLREGYPPRIE